MHASKESLAYGERREIPALVSDAEFHSSGPELCDDSASDKIRLLRGRELDPRYDFAAH